MVVHWIVKVLVGAGVGFAFREVRNATTKRKPDQQQVHHHYEYVHVQHPHTNDDVRKDLKSSLSFFEEGTAMLQRTLDRMAGVNNDGETKELKTEKCGPIMTGKTDLSVSGLQALAVDVKAMKAIAGEDFAWAKSSFKAARDDATRAFHNEALSTQDRILAAKLRITSTILGCLEEPETAMVVCKIYLNELNSMPQVEKFNIHQKGVQDMAILTCVVRINYMVFCFTETVAEGLLNAGNWPKIKIFSDHSLHPIRSLRMKQVILENEEWNDNLEPQSLSFDNLSDPVDMTVNSNGEFLVVDWDSTDGNSVKVFSSSGVFQFSFSPTNEEMKGQVFKPRAVSTDQDNNIYVYTEAQGQNDILSGVLFVFDKEGKVKRQIPTECAGFMVFEKKTNKIALSCVNGIYEYESSGECLKTILVPDLLGSVNPIAVCDDGMILADALDDVIHIITDKGERRQFKVNGAGGWKYVAFNHISDEIIISYLSKGLSHFQLQSYSKSGRLLAMIQLPEEYSSHPKAIAVTPNERIAVLYENNVHLI